MASGTVSSDTTKTGTFPDLQSAIKQAQFGDTLTLFANQNYSGNFTLPIPTGNAALGHVIITSSMASNLPALNVNQPWVGRVSPSDAPNMPRITGNPFDISKPLLLATNGAHH